jgi:hypothetical protein
VDYNEYIRIKQDLGWVNLFSTNGVTCSRVHIEVFSRSVCVPVLGGTREVKGCRLYGPGPKAMSDLAQNFSHDHYYE